MALRMPIAENWWPDQNGVERNFVTGRTKIRSGVCHENCSINREKWLGDNASEIGYLTEKESRLKRSPFVRIRDFFRQLNG